MNKKIYKGAIVGCGIISKFHAMAYSNVENVELKAVCDININNANKLAKAYTVSNVYTDYKKLFAEENLDFVEILTPHTQRLDIINEAARKNININLQKVPAVSIQEFDEIKKIVKTNNIILRVFENFRYYEPYIFAKDLIDKGVIGSVENINIKKYGGSRNYMDKDIVQGLNAAKWRMTEKENYKHPTLFDDGYHKHSIIEYFLGEPIEKLRAWCGYKEVIPGIKLDSPADIQYFTKSNKLGTFQTINIDIRVENNFYSCDEVIDIVGSKGLIMIFGGHGELFTKAHESKIKKGVYWLNTKYKWQFSDQMNMDIRNSFTVGLTEFIKLLDETTNVKFNLVDAENSLRMGLAIVESLRNGFGFVYTKDMK